MRQIEEANKLELALSIKALVARALANELIEGGDVRYWPVTDIRSTPVDVRYWGKTGHSPTVVHRPQFMSTRPKRPRPVIVKIKVVALARVD